MTETIHIGLAGNPNAGKTTLFNALTGARQHTGNWPGVTVEKKEGIIQRNGYQITLVDLPGTYSLTAYSLEERLVRQFIIEARPDVIVDVVDASNMDRNLYLTAQLIEMGIPVVVVLNMSDVAEKQGIKINTAKLSNLIGAPVVIASARTKAGIDEILDQAISLAKSVPHINQNQRISYGEGVDSECRIIEKHMTAWPKQYNRLQKQWLAAKLLENDKELVNAFQEQPDHDAFLDQVRESRDRIFARHGDSPEFVMTDARYRWVARIVQQSVHKTVGDQVTASETIDKVLTHRFFGPVIMLGALYGVYAFTFYGSEPLVDLMERFFSRIGELTMTIIPDGPLQSLVVSGIIDGVGGVLGFTPLIAFMFLAITFLEDTGYVTRIAFMLDRILHAFGLHGASMLALMVSGGIAGGCAVPGIMATRTMREPKERLVTILVAPLMNCGAKLPIYALLIGAFFPGNKALMMLALTVISWIMALLAAKVIRSTILSGPDAPFMLELPPYRVPTLRGLLTNTWDRTWMYVRKAGTVILAISVMLWTMMNYPSLPVEREAQFAEQEAAIAAVFLSTPSVDQVFRSKTDVDRFAERWRIQVSENHQSDESQTAAFAAMVAAMGPDSSNFKVEADFLAPPMGPVAEAYFAYWNELRQLDANRQSAHLRNTLGGRIGKALETFFKPIGFDWKTSVALLGGFAAKEIVVSTLGTAYSLSDVDPVATGGLSERLQKEPGWTPVLAFSLIMFVMLYSPCFCTLVMIKKETGTWRWVIFAMLYTTILAYAAALAVRLAGTFFRWGVP